MQHVRCVDVTKAAEHLIRKVLSVFIGELVLRVNDFVHVGLHEAEHNVHVFKVVFRGRVN